MNDVLVVGGQLSGIVAATLLARRGFKVAWLEHDGLNDAYEYQGYLFPYAPSVLPSLKELPIFEAIIEELGLTDDVQKGLRPNHPSLQWVLTRHRLDLGAEASSLHAELQREFPKSAGALEEALRQWSLYHPRTDEAFLTPELPAVGFWEAFWARRRLSRLPSGPQSEAWVPHGLLSLRQGLLPFLQYSVENQGQGPQLRPLSQVLLSSYHFPGGRQGLLDLFRKKLVALGGTVFPSGTVAEELLFDGSRAVGVRCSKNAEEALARVVLVATDSGALHRLIKNARWLRKMKADAPTAEIEQFQLALNWVLPRQALPMGMGELVFVADQSENSPILVQVSPARKAHGTTGETDEVNVCAGTFVPARVRGKDPAPIHDSLHALERRLSALMPFSQEAVKQLSSPYLHAKAPRASRLMPHPLFRQPKPWFPGLGGRTMKTSARNLVLANREVLPGLGFEGELLTGNKAARWAQSMVGGKKALPAQSTGGTGNSRPF